MKKALNINLGGIIFHIDEDAYERLHQYLMGLEKKFGNTADSKEIIADIESRMAELLQERISRNKQSVDMSDVDYVIAVMGGPDEVVEEAPYVHGEGSSKRWYQRKLYRDPDNAVIGGICSGLGAFFGIDPVILRILFLVLLFFGGTSVLLYLILWIALPAARTPMQKLEMRGEDVNVTNIEKATREQTYNTPQNRWQAFFDTLGRIVGGILKAAVKVVAVLAGLLFIIIGSSILLFYFVFNAGVMDGFHPVDFHFSLPMLFHYAVVQGHWAFQLANFLIFILPILAIIYLGIKLLLGLRFNDRPIWISALILWLLGIVLWITLTIFSFKEIRNQGVVMEQWQLKAIPDRTLTIEVNEPWAMSRNIRRQMKVNDQTMYYINTKNEIVGKTELIIERAPGQTPEVIMEKISRGKNSQEAEMWAQKIAVSLSQNDSLLYIPSSFVISNRKDWRMQQLKLTVKIPAGQTIYLSPQLKDILIDADLNETRWISELPGNTWIMTPNGLQQANRQP